MFLAPHIYDMNSEAFSYNVELKCRFHCFLGGVSSAEISALLSMFWLQGCHIKTLTYSIAYTQLEA